jgi:uncharacterized protein
VDLRPDRNLREDRRRQPEAEGLAGGDRSEILSYGERTGPSALGPIPAKAGIGLRFPHHDALLAEPAPVGWLEVHAENYFGGGRPRHCLERLADDYPISLHGVGLSLGGAEPLDRGHLARLKALAEAIRPGLVSEHVAWSGVGGVYLNDLLPVPYTEEALAALVRNIDAAQQFLGRRILIENPSTYLAFAESRMPEWAFIAAAIERSGCGLLLDVNNVYVSARNHGFDPSAYLAAMPSAAIEEIHLAGHLTREIDGVELRIDDHGSAVDDAVWSLYRATVARIGARPTLIEWDTRIPPLATLVAEAAKADRILAEPTAGARHVAA